MELEKSSEISLFSFLLNPYYNISFDLKFLWSIEIFFTWRINRPNSRCRWLYCSNPIIFPFSLYFKYFSPEAKKKKKKTGRRRKRRRIRRKISFHIWMIIIKGRNHWVLTRWCLPWRNSRPISYELHVLKYVFY